MGGTEGGGTSGKNFDFFLWSHGHGYVELVVAMRLVLIKKNEDENYYFHEFSWRLLKLLYTRKAITSVKVVTETATPAHKVIMDQCLKRQGGSRW